MQKNDAKPSEPTEKRKYLNRRQKLEVLDRCKVCSWCKHAMPDAEFADDRVLKSLAWDHIKPLGLYGTNDLCNWQAMHYGCHREKTREDKKRIAKAKRIEKKRLGLEPKPRRKIRSRGFQKPWKPISSK